MGLSKEVCVCLSSVYTKHLLQAGLLILFFYSTFPRHVQLDVFSYYSMLCTLLLVFVKMELEREV